MNEIAATKHIFTIFTFNGEYNCVDEADERDFSKQYNVHVFYLAIDTSCTKVTP